jgi:UDP-N-acetylglucosamine transferase subunit ALG13
VILVTTGTNGSSFDRLLAEVAGLGVAEELVVQYGPSTIRPANAVCVPYMSFSELRDRVREARVVITHGGVGSILLSIMNGKRPIVVPRLARYGEAVDDHQLGLTRRLAESGFVTLAEDTTRLISMVDGLEPQIQHGERILAGPLSTDLASYVDQCCRLSDAPPSTRV